MGFSLVRWQESYTRVNATNILIQIFNVIQVYLVMSQSQYFITPDHFILAI